MTLLLKGKLIAVFLLLIAVDCYSQNEMLSEAIYYQNRNKIVEVFGEEFLANNNELIAVYDRIISDNIHYHLIPLASDEKYPLLSSYSLNNKVNPMVQAIDFGQFNPWSYLRRGLVIGS